MNGPFFEDFSEGQTLSHRTTKTITESDNNLFCLLTMNHHPVHLDAEYAARSEYGRQLVVGTLVLGLTVGLTVPEISRSAIANLSFADVEHVAPTYIGDTISARSRVLQVRPSKSKPDRGVVTVETEAVDQRGRVVIRFQRSVMLPRRP